MMRQSKHKPRAIQKNASVNEWKSNFASVRKVKAVPHRNLIKVSELLTKNRIFVDNPEDYKFVLDYIRQRCPRVNRPRRT